MKLEGYDWKDAIEAACRDSIVAVGDAPVSTEPFTVDDVEEVIHSDEGENDGPHWVAVVKLKDGRFFAINAWCDYTGWG